MNKKEYPAIKILDLRHQIAGFSGRYNPNKDIIEIGTIPQDVPKVLWHEFFHAFLFKNCDLECARMWDNIVYKIEKFLYGYDTATPYIYGKDVVVPPYQSPKHRTLEEKYGIKTIKALHQIQDIKNSQKHKSHTQVIKQSKRRNR